MLEMGLVRIKRTIEQIKTKMLHARSMLGALHTTPRGALSGESGFTPTYEILDSRQQRFAARLADACIIK